MFEVKSIILKNTDDDVVEVIESPAKFAAENVEVINELQDNVFTPVMFQF
jgi:hypothetical protein